MRRTPCPILIVGLVTSLFGGSARCADYSGPPILLKNPPTQSGTAVTIRGEPPPEIKPFQPPGIQQVQALPAKDLVPTDEIANQQVDTALTRWSSAWMFDRYIRGTSSVIERAMIKDNYFIRGSFVFARGGKRLTIPFGAVFTPVGSTYKFSRLCYEDDSSGMSDCVDPGDGIDQRQVQANQTRQFLAAIAAVGVVSALSRSPGVVSSDTSLSVHSGSQRESNRTLRCVPVMSCADDWTDFYGNVVRGTCTQIRQDCN